MGRFLLSVVIGFVISFPIVCLIAGGIEECLGLLLMSIVCTAGVGLVAWVPIWWVVGAGSLAIVGLFTERLRKIENKSTQKSGQKSAPNTNRREIVRSYLQRASVAGVDQEESARLLRLNGWDPGEVQVAIQQFNASRIKA